MFQRAPVKVLIKTRGNAGMDEVLNQLRRLGCRPNYDGDVNWTFGEITVSVQRRHIRTIRQLPLVQRVTIQTPLRAWLSKLTPA